MNPKPNNGKPGPGRPKGTLNKATHEIKEFMRSITLDSPEYCASLEERAKTGKLHPLIEKTCLAYGYGNPVEKIQLDVSVVHDLTALTTAQLAERARLLAARIEDPNILDAEVVK